MDAEEIRPAFDHSSVLFRGLEALGWGPLLNLGYFSLLELPLLMRGLGPFQRRLARKSIALLEARPGERVLDVGCGRGWTTAWIARTGAHAVGLDLLEEHVARARSLFGDRPGVAFVCGDATRILESAGGTIGEAGFDRIHCLEAAFQFGAQGRRAFLADAYTALRPGGRLVIVDFTWNSDDPSEVEQCDERELVRGAWRFEEFEPLARYRATAKACGFVEHRILDWSVPVTRRFQTIGDAVLGAAQHRLGLAVLRLFRPGVAILTLEEFKLLREIVAAHDRVRRRSSYTAMVFEKPADGANRPRL
jgi:SAM-dependent methyltransferase